MQNRERLSWGVLRREAAAPRQAASPLSYIHFLPSVMEKNRKSWKQTNDQQQQQQQERKIKQHGEKGGHDTNGVRQNPEVLRQKMHTSRVLLLIIIMFFLPEHVRCLPTLPAVLSESLLELPGVDHVLGPERVLRLDLEGACIKWFQPSQRGRRGTADRCPRGTARNGASKPR